MPAAFYAISFKATCSVLAVCSLEKQSPADKEAWDKLRDGLVGSKLPIDLLSAQRFEIPASFLAVDAIDATLDADAISSPYLYELSLASADPVEAGDGKPKLVNKPAGNSVTSVVGNDAAKEIRITLQHVVQAPAWLLYEDQSPLAGTVDPTNNKRVIFRLATNVTIASGNQFLFLLKGARVRARKLP